MADTTELLIPNRPMSQPAAVVAIQVVSAHLKPLLGYPIGQCPLKTIVSRIVHTRSHKCKYSLALPLARVGLPYSKIFVIECVGVALSSCAYVCRNPCAFTHWSVAAVWHIGQWQQCGSFTQWSVAAVWLVHTVVSGSSVFAIANTLCVHCLTLTGWVLRETDTSHATTDEGQRAK